MALVDYKQNKIQLKFVYCGAQNAGVTSTLTSIHKDVYGEEPDWHTNNEGAASIRDMLSNLFPVRNKTKVRSNPSEFFAIETGTVQGFEISVLLYGCSLPEGAGELSDRMRGADSVIFVANSEAEMQQQNLEALKTLRKLLEAPDLLRAVQLNKRDAKKALPSTCLKQQLALPDDVHVVETVASEAEGTVACFREVLKRTLNCLT